MSEEGVGPTVEERDCDHVVSLFRDGQHRVVHRRASRRKRQTGDTAFQLRDSLLQHVVGGVHNPGVDVARNSQVEKVGSMLGVVKFVGDGLVDRDSDGLGGGVCFVAGVNGESFLFHGPVLRELYPNTFPLGRIEKISSHSSTRGLGGCSDRRPARKDDTDPGG